MALIFEDTPDYYTLAAQTNVRYSSLPTLSLATGNFGGNEYTTHTTPITKVLSYAISNTVPVNVGFWYRNITVATATQTSLLTTNTDIANYVTLGVASGLNVLRSQTPAGFTSGTRTILDGEFHWIECSILYSATGSGYIKVYVDGLLDINFSGATISGTLPATLNTFTFGTLDYERGRWGSFYFWDGSGSDFNTFPRDPMRTNVLTPNAAGDLSEFTPLAGANYTNVNSGFAGTGNVSDGTTGKTDLYNFSNLSYTPNEVFCVVGNYYGQNVGGVGTATLIPKIKTAGVTLSGTPQLLPLLNSDNLTEYFYTDASSALWTAVTVNAMQLGMGD